MFGLGWGENRYPPLKTPQVVGCVTPANRRGRYMGRGSSLLPLSHGQDIVQGWGWLGGSRSGLPLSPMLPQWGGVFSPARQARLSAQDSGSAFFLPGARLSLEAERFSYRLGVESPSHRLSQPAQGSTKGLKRLCSTHTIPFHRHTWR